MGFPITHIALTIRDPAGVARPSLVEHKHAEYRPRHAHTGDMITVTPDIVHMSHCYMS